MTSTPIRREVTPPADESQCHHDCEDDFETMDSSMFVLAEEIALLRNRIRDLESRQGIHVLKCDSATQTDPLDTQDVGAEMNPQRLEKSHQVDTQNTIKPGTSNAQTYAEICAKGGNPGTKPGSKTTEAKPIKQDKFRINSVKSGPSKPQNSDAENSRNDRTRTHSGNQQSQDSSNSPTLIIGSSIVQRIDSRRLRKNVSVMKMSGATTSDVRAKIDSMDLSEIENVILQVGGNDASNKRDRKAVEIDLVETVNTIKEKSPNATCVHFRCYAKSRCRCALCEQNHS